MKKLLSGSIPLKFLLLLSTAYVASGINMQGFLAMMPLVREDFALTRAQAGLYSTFYFSSATAVALFSGRVVDRAGSKKGIVFGAGSVGLIMIIHSLAPVFSLLLFMALLAGIGFSIITPSVNKAVMKKVPPGSRAISMGIMQSGGGIGGFIGASLLPFIGVRFGWRTALMMSGSAALIIALFLNRFYFDIEKSDVPEQKKIDTQNERANNDSFDEGENRSSRNETNQSELSFKNSFLHLVKNGKLLSVCFIGLVFSLATGAIPTHFTLYLTQDLQVSGAAAGLGFGFLEIGGVVGRPFWGGFSDKVLSGSRSRGLLIMGVLITAALIYFSFVITLFTPALVLVYISSFFLGLLGLGWQGLHLTTVAELATEKFTGMATGLALVFIRIGIVVSPPVFGWLADTTSTYFHSWLIAGIFILFFTGVFFLIFRRLF